MCIRNTASCYSCDCVCVLSKLYLVSLLNRLQFAVCPVLGFN